MFNGFVFDRVRGKEHQQTLGHDASKICNGVACRWLNKSIDGYRKSQQGGTCNAKIWNTDKW